MTKANLITLAAFCITLFFANKIHNDLESNYNKVVNVQIMQELILERIEADVSERKKIIKLKKNNEIWKGTECIKCHNTINTALPINKIPITEAIKIVRFGNEKTKAAGMPLFSRDNRRAPHYMSDDDLEIKLQFLYTNDLLN